MYETDFTKGVYKLEDFCNALKDNNCIIDDRVFINWLYLVNSSLYDSVRFVIFNKVGELTYGLWIACNHDLVITDYTKQEWKDFYPLNENTSRIWERLLFQSAVKPVESFDEHEDVNTSEHEDANISVCKIKVHKIKICSKRNLKEI